MNLAPNIVNRIEVGDCWVWRGATDKDGYGLGKVAGRMVRVHRYVWKTLVGPLRDDELLDHKCRNRACCNPKHLRPVTAKQNSTENSLGITAANAAKTHCPQGHPYDITRGRIRRSRWCRTCNRDAMRRYRHRLKTAQIT